jgi:hypothetical protein
MKNNRSKLRLHDTVDVSPEERTTCELVTLIRKLRWIGLETEARHLQTVLRKIPLPNRADTGPRRSDNVQQHKT